jgi:hypothetical protein
MAVVNTNLEVEHCVFASFACRRYWLLGYTLHALPSHPPHETKFFVRPSSLFMCQEKMVTD